MKHKFDHNLEKVLQVLESVIAVATTVVLIVLLGYELFHVVTDPASLVAEDGLSHFLHEMLTIVVGLEFVKLLMHVTPENVLEVLITAVARHFVAGHATAVENLLSVVCVLLCVVGIALYRKLSGNRSETHEEKEHTHSH